MKKLKVLLSLVLCICLCIGTMTPAMAANESNTLGVTISAALDTPTLQVSNVDQTVTMTVSTSTGVTLSGIGGTVVWPEALQLTGIYNTDNRLTCGAADINLANGKFLAYTADIENISDVSCIAVATFTVPAGTPAGNYVVSVEEIELSSNYGVDVWENGATASAILTIEGDVSVEGYTAGISSAYAEVTRGDTCTVNVNTGHDTYTQFAASEVKLTYDPTYLTFDENASTLNGAVVKEANGVLTLEDHGEDQNLGTGTYMLAFTANTAGDAKVELISAAFGTNEEAETDDLEAATLGVAAVTVNVKPISYPVILPDIFTGDGVVTEGEDYTFGTDAVGGYYDYDNVTAAVNGVEVPVVDNGDGTWTISGADITGNLEISADRTPKSFEVTITGETAANDGGTATYGTDYSFTLPEDVAAGSEVGYTYALTSVTIGGNAYSGYTVSGKSYTIPGTDVTGDIAIVITRTEIPANSYTVSVEGSGAGAAVGDFPAVVTQGDDFTLTLEPETGYEYTVTVQGYDVTVDGNTYTISNILGNVTFQVEKSVVITDVAVSEYVTLANESRMWLVKNVTTKLDGKVYTYNGEAMYWSDVYKAYCILVVADTQPGADAGDFEIISGTVKDVTYDMDVNMSGLVDANDAQLVYNIYQARYDGFTAKVTMEKFLRADTNGSGIVDTTDAVAIITNILTPAT